MGEVFFSSKITISPLDFGAGLNLFFLRCLWQRFLFLTPQVSEVFFKPQQRVKFFFVFVLFCFVLFFQKISLPHSDIKWCAPKSTVCKGVVQGAASDLL